MKRHHRAPSHRMLMHDSHRLTAPSHSLLMTDANRSRGPSWLTFAAPLSQNMQVVSCLHLVVVLAKIQEWELILLLRDSPVVASNNTSAEQGWRSTLGAGQVAEHVGVHAVSVRPAQSA